MDTSGITHTTEDENVKVKFETLRAMEQGDTLNMDSHMTDRVSAFYYRRICLINVVVAFRTYVQLIAF